MLRLLVLSLFLGAPVAAQAPPGGWPAPGDGFDWQTVGDRPVKAKHLAFDADGRLWAAGSSLRDPAFLYRNGRLDNPDDPASVWASFPATRGGARMLALSPDSVLIGEAFVHRTTDGGETWASHQPSCGAKRAFVAAPTDTPPGPWGALAGDLFAGFANLCRSTDRGETWTEVPFVTPPSSPIIINDAVVLPAGHPYAGRLVVATDERVHLSDETRAELTLRPAAGPALYYPEDFAVMPSGRLIATGIDPTKPDRQVELSDDGGESWHSTQPLPVLVDGITGPARMAVLGPGAAVAIGGRGFVYRTDDDGATWALVGRAPITEGHVSVRHVVVGPQGRLYIAVSQAGNQSEFSWVYRTASPVVVADEAAPVAPPAVGVTVSPNPSSGRVAVGVALPEPSASVRVEVFDSVGRRVAVLHEGAARGALSLDVDTRAWAPGVYVVRVTGDAAPGSGSGAGSGTARFTVAR